MIFVEFHDVITGIIFLEFNSFRDHQIIIKLDSIPVGCVPPASVATLNRMTDRQV